jgi:hypothetical protein
MDGSHDPTGSGAPKAVQVVRGDAPADRSESYARWCLPLGRRSARSSGCLCASAGRSGDCGERPARMGPTYPQVVGAAGSPSSAARSSSDIAPSPSQMPK